MVRIQGTDHKLAAGFLPVVARMATLIKIGAINIHSRQGKGTRLGIKVPLTILPTPMVEVGTQVFALPLTNINEIFHLDLTKTHVVDGLRTNVVRGHAIPLVDRGGIHPLGEVTRLPGKPGWFAGMVSHGDTRYHLVNSGRWFMADSAGGEQYAYFGVLGGTSWGLGISRLLGTESLHRDDVRWRSAPGSRPWSAGTVKSRMCVLLYSGYLAQAIDLGLPV